MNARTAAEILRKNRITTKSTALGRYYAICPQCSMKRKKANQKLKCLGVTIDADGVSAGCNHCQWTGGGFYRAAERAAPVAAVDPAELERAQVRAAERRRIAIAHSQVTVKWLWAQRQPIVKSPAEIYLREVREYTRPLPPTLGFL